MHTTKSGRPLKHYELHHFFSFRGGWVGESRRGGLLVPPGSQNSLRKVAEVEIEGPVIFVNGVKLTVGHVPGCTPNMQLNIFTAARFPRHRTIPYPPYTTRSSLKITPVL